MKLLIVITILIVHTLAAVHKFPGDSGKCGCCPQCCSCICEESKAKSLEIAVLHDSSASIRPFEWTRSKDFIAQVLSGIYCPGNKMAHLSFSTNVSLNWNLYSAISTSLPQTLTMLAGLEQFEVDQTNTVLALEVLLEEIFNGNDDPNVPNVALMFTDGKATHNVHLLRELALEVHKTVKVLVVGVSDKVNITQLSLIASGPGMTNVFLVDDLNDLSRMASAVIKAITDMFPCKNETKDCFCCCPPPEPFPKPYYKPHPMSYPSPYPLPQPMHYPKPYPKPYYGGCGHHGDTCGPHGDTCGHHGDTCGYHGDTCGHHGDTWGHHDDTW